MPSACTVQRYSLRKSRYGMTVGNVSVLDRQRPTSSAYQTNRVFFSQFDHTTKTVRKCRHMREKFYFVVHGISFAGRRLYNGLSPVYVICMHGGRVMMLRIPSDMARQSTPCAEKGAAIFLPLTLPNSDRFSKFFPRQNYTSKFLAKR